MNSCIVVRLPSDHLEERKYAIDCLFTYILGVPYSLETRNAVFTEICVGDNAVQINDHFWTVFFDDCYSEKNLPHVVYGRNQFSKEADIPILYGTEIVEIKKQRIICDIDIFASSFFMLSRWEEYINNNYDKHNRFNTSDSIAFKYGFIDRPIVNEYALLLWNMITYFDCSLERKNDFRLILTHDIDYLSLPSPQSTVFRNFAYELLRKKRFKSAFYNLKESMLHDPYNQYDFFMRNSEYIGEKSHFYFMAASEAIDCYNDNNYLHRSKFKKIVKTINKRGHIVGIHPSYYTFNNEEKWGKEYFLLEQSVGAQIKESRQHYLRFAWPITAKICGSRIEIDSTLGFADTDGYRCGTGNFFPLFDLDDKKVLGVLEQPLIVMDTTLTAYKQLTVKESEKLYIKYIDLSNKYSMPLTLLFHNSSFYGVKWAGWSIMYKNILHYYFQKKHEIK